MDAQTTQTDVPCILQDSVPSGSLRGRCPKRGGGEEKGRSGDERKGEKVEKRRCMVVGRLRQDIPTWRSPCLKKKDLPRDFKYAVNSTYDKLGYEK